MNSIIFAVFTSIAFSHSWLECTEYDGDLETFERDQCKGLPRPLDANGRNVGGTFGQDIGMDFRPQDGGARCQGDATLGTAQNYPNGMRTYEKGRSYTLAWAPKNHAAATCTNAFIPDNFLRLYMTPYNQAAGDPDQDTFRQMQVPASFSDDPHVQGVIDFKGFQNCPRFCDDTDKSLCTGTFTIAEDVAPGTYTFQWYWAFNSPTDIYSTCWEAIVVDGTGTGGTGNTPASTALPQTTTTLQTTPAGCTDCCDGSSIQAPGTGAMVTYDYLLGDEMRWLDCPSGFDGQFKIMCLDTDVRLVDGWCLPQSSGASTSEDEEKIAKKNEAIVWLSLTLTFVTLSFISYVAVTRGWVTEETFKDLFSSDGTPKKDVESFGTSVPEKRSGRANSVFTQSNTELPVVPDTPVWYYVDKAGDQTGPVTRAQLVSYCNSVSRKVAEETLIWDGVVCTDWTPVKAVVVIKQEIARD